MRRPGPIQIDRFVAALDRQLRREVGQTSRSRLPELVHRLGRMLRTRAQPLLRGGALVITSMAVVVAVGAAPATLDQANPTDSPLAIPTEDPFLDDGETAHHLDQLPREEFLAADTLEMQNPDIPDIALMGME